MALAHVSDRRRPLLGQASHQHPIRRSVRVKMAIARTDVQQVFALLVEVFRGMGAMLGKNALGMGLIRNMDLTAPHFLAFFVIFMVRLRRTNVDQNLATLKQVGEQHVEIGRRAQQLFRAIRREMPLIGKRLDYYNHQIVKGHGSFASVNEQIRQLRNEFPDEFDAFFGRHPEFVPPIEEEEQ